jgi:L-lysine exporter family protein LysE/ArgO
LVERTGLLVDSLLATSLGYGARLLAPVFARPRAWQVLDALIGLTMLGISALLVQRLLVSLNP